MRHSLAETEPLTASRHRMVPELCHHNKWLFLRAYLIPAPKRPVAVPFTVSTLVRVLFIRAREDTRGRERTIILFPTLSQMTVTRPPHLSISFWFNFSFTSIVDSDHLMRRFPALFCNSVSSRCFIASAITDIGSPFPYHSAKHLCVHLTLLFFFLSLSFPLY